MTNCEEYYLWMLGLDVYYFKHFGTKKSIHFMIRKTYTLFQIPGFFLAVVCWFHLLLLLLLSPFSRV